MDKVTKAMTAARYALFNTHSNGKAKAVKTTAADVVWPERRDYDLYESPTQRPLSPRRSLRNSRSQRGLRIENGRKAP